MSTRWTAHDLAKVNARIQARIADPVAKTSGHINVPVAKRTKYRNIRAVWQGEKFDSQKELRDYKHFLLEKLAGNIRAVVRQVSFRLPNTSRRIRVDFIVVENDGTLRWKDSKGKACDKWLLKRQIVQDAFGITIEHI